MSNLKVSFAAANAQAVALAALSAGGSLVIYSGSQPATPETTVGSGVVLASFALVSPAFAAPVNGQLMLNAPTPTSVTTAGTATWFRVYAADGVTALFDGNIGAVVEAAWAQSTAYALGVIVGANNNSYQCTTAGTSATTGAGPSGAGSAIADGTVVWQYVAIAYADINFSNVIFALGNTISLSSYTYQVQGA
jgi:hypothetical protein